MKKKKGEIGRDFYAVVSEQFKDTARTSSTRIKVVGTGSGARARGDTPRRYARVSPASQSRSRSLATFLKIDLGNRAVVTIVIFLSLSLRVCDYAPLLKISDTSRSSSPVRRKLRIFTVPEIIAHIRPQVCLRLTTLTAINSS